MQVPIRYSVLAMKIVIQRVHSASVAVDDTTVGAIEHGLLLYVGFGLADSTVSFDKAIAKIVSLRLFPGEQGRFDRSLSELSEVSKLLIVSQFTLYASISKGRRPDFFDAKPPNEAKALYEAFVATARSILPGRVETGVFGAHMIVSARNDGPVTLLTEW
jgi:D-tyrosyl-tRNA(Tyr) deacylase